MNSDDTSSADSTPPAISEATETPPASGVAVSNPFQVDGKPIPGTEGLSVKEILEEVHNGGRFATAMYCVSILVMTFNRPMGLRFYRAGESGTRAALFGTVLTTMFGWWGIPWGPIYSIGAILSNLRGGKDLTRDILTSAVGEQQTREFMATRTKPRTSGSTWVMRAVVLGLPLFIIGSCVNFAMRTERLEKERLTADPAFAAFASATDSLRDGSAGNTPEVRVVAIQVSRFVDEIVSESADGSDKATKAGSSSAYLHFDDNKAVALVRIPALRFFTDGAKQEILDVLWGIVGNAASQQLSEGTPLSLAIQGKVLWDSGLVGKTGPADADEPPLPRRRLNNSREVKDHLEGVFK